MSALLSTLSMSPSVVTPTVCIHCGNPVTSSSQFCCSGCETVYYWIQNHHLEKFYDLKKNGRPLRKSTPVSGTGSTFQYLDDAEFLNLYSWQTPEGRWMEFYLEGVHCAACIWLTEKVAEIVDHVGFIRLNLGSSIATVRIDEEGSFSAVASELQKMGYQPHPVKRGEYEGFQKKENRRFLIRIGIAGASAGNIMLLAVSLYGGASGVLAERFRWLSLALFLPVLIYSAIPFYQSAWAAIRSKQLSIDIPVVFGILLGSFVSIFNLWIGDDRVYFDSLSALIFLLLSTRYLLKRTQQSALESSHLLHFLTPSSVKKWNVEFKKYQEVKTDQISIGDRIQVLPGESVPVDGMVVEGTSFLNCALLSGESEPQKIGPDDVIFAGTLNLEAPLEIQVTQSGSQTRLGRILDSTEALLTKKASISAFADRVSRYFVAAVMILSGLTFVWNFPSDWHEGLNRALAIAIVTCPCTFALITPLALSMTLGRLAKAGILVKGPEVLEKLTRIRSVFLDKTGTLTYGTPQVTLWEVPQDLSAIIFAIESHSSHPVAKAIVNFLGPQISDSLPHLEEIQETMGLGIRARIGTLWIEIRRAESSTEGTELSVFRNHVKVGRVVLMDQVRPDSETAVELLRSLKLTPWLLSGDQQTPVNQVARSVGIETKNRYFEISPEEKGSIIKTHSPTLMIGDGANDALALAQAFVSIAVHSGVEISLRAADIYIRLPGVLPIYDVIVISRETLRVVRRNFYFSIVYNLIACGFALAGKIDPLLAAVLMPLSALTVFLSSVVGTISMRKAFRRLER